MLIDSAAKQERLAAIRKSALANPKPLSKKRQARKQRKPVYRTPYLAYIHSAEWLALKITILAQRGAKCERCASDRRLNLHHKTYARLFNERPEDLEVLCHRCHEQHHGIVTVTGNPTTTATGSAQGINHLSVKWDLTAKPSKHRTHK
jgi:hypothetical protein